MTQSLPPDGVSVPLSRRAALQLLFSTASAALLAACGSGATPAAPAPTSAAPPPTAAAAPAPANSTGAAAPAPAPTVAVSAPAKPQQVKTGGRLRVGMVGDITALDPFVWSPNNSNTVGQVHDQLITYDEKFAPQPRLA